VTPDGLDDKRPLTGGSDSVVVSSDRLEVVDELSDECDYDNDGEHFYIKKSKHRNKEYQKLNNSAFLGKDDDEDSGSDYCAADDGKINNMSDHDEKDSIKHLRKNRKNVSYIENVFKLLSEINTEPSKPVASSSSLAGKKLASLRPRTVSNRKEKKSAHQQQQHRHQQQQPLFSSLHSTDEQHASPKKSNIFSATSKFTKSGLQPLLNGDFFEEENL
jgi:hypothetical protein